MMNNKIIDILAKIGKALYLDEDSEKILTNIDSGNYVCYSSNWDKKMIKMFDNNKLINVFKGLIISEQCYTQYCGSTSIGIVLYREIKNRKLDEDLKIANWAYLNTKNGYIPFGSNGNIRSESKNAYEYIHNQILHSYKIKYEKEKKAERLLIEKIKGLEKRIEQKEKEINELKKRLERSKLPRKVIAEMIINDDKKPVYYYYHEIETLINDKSIDKVTLKKILDKFKEKEKRNTRILKNKLIKEINNR